MIGPDKREAPIAIEETRVNPEPQPEREPTPHSLPASMYAAQLPPEVVQQDIRIVQQGIEERVPGPTIASAIVEEHWSHGGDRVVTAAYDYAADLYQSVLNRPEHTAEQRIEQMQPTPAERQHWEPLIQAVPLEVADSFAWTGANGTVQSYQHESTQNYLHIDGPSGQFYDRDKNAISPQVALDRALPAEFGNQLSRTGDPSISHAAELSL